MSDLSDLMSRIRGKQDLERALDFIGEDSSLIDELSSLVFIDDRKISMRAAWTLRYVAESFPDLVEHHLEHLVERLESISSSCQRSLLNVLDCYAIPDELEDDVYHSCFNILLNKSSAIANQAICMSIASKICFKYPELSNELILVIEDLLINGSAGIKSRGNKIISQLRKT